jgi:hypothetical protein
MNPSIELRLRTMIRAVTEVIAPALDPQDSLAREQSQLLLGHLHALLQQHTHEAGMERLEYHALGELARALTATCAGGPVTTSAAADLRALPPDATTAVIAHAVERLLIASGEDGSETFQRASAALVLDHARESALRGRAWFKPMGFDSSPESLPAIDTLLDQPEETP